MPEDKKTDTTKDAPLKPEASTETTSSPDVNLTVADLRNLRTIIDIASSRGAFRGPELKPVGEAYDKLDQFVKAIDAKAQAETPAPTEGENKEAPAEEKK